MTRLLKAHYCLLFVFGGKGAVFKERQSYPRTRQDPGPARRARCAVCAALLTPAGLGAGPGRGQDTAPSVGARASRPPPAPSAGDPCAPCPALGLEAAGTLGLGGRGRLRVRGEEDAARPVGPQGPHDLLWLELSSD